MICHKIGTSRLLSSILALLAVLSGGGLISACTAVISPSPSPSPLPTVELLPASTVITGTVMDVALSAGVIFLDQPDPWEIAITDQTEILNEEGEKIALHDLRPGMQIRASGEVTGFQTMIASQIAVLKK